MIRVWGASPPSPAMGAAEARRAAREKPQGGFERVHVGVGLDDGSGQVRAVRHEGARARLRQAPLLEDTRRLDPSADAPPSDPSAGCSMIGHGTASKRSSCMPVGSEASGIEARP